MAVAMGDFIQRYPLLRLLFSYLCGIGLTDIIYPYLPSLVTFSVCGILFLSLLLFLRIKQRSLSYGVLASLLFLMIGIWNYSWTRENSEYDWTSKELLYEARVMEIPRVRQRSVLCEIEVTAVCDSLTWHRIGRKAWAYMEPCDEVEMLLPGDRLCFKGKVRVPHNFSDSLAFNYARYVTLQGISGTVYLPHDKWIKVGGGSFSLREGMLRLQHRLKERYIVKTFDGDVLHVLSALTLGDKRGINKELLAIYSDAGASHVLALSGLHIGVIYGILTFVMSGLFRRRGLKWVRDLLTIAILWLFALLVGMPASVVRTVVMCSLYVFARWLSDGSSSSLHVLSLTALLMLLVHPLYLFDVGFQLSFMAMATILCVEPHLEEVFRRHDFHPFWGYLIGLLCMSLAAQLGTFPLILYYFGSFPVYFLITNLLVVPCLFVVLLISVAWWILILLGAPWHSLLGVLLQHFVGWINKILWHIGQWPGAVVRVEGYGVVSVLFTYLFILFASLFLINKWKRGAVLAMASLLGIVLSLLFNL